ncbi:MAG: ABC transporter permease, partial [Chloroflexota bacterium]|nr:ABC transporter permease [Chloroflexota bacterium]
MLAYLVQRVLQGLLVIFLVSLLTFFVMQAAPGDPVRLLVGDGTYITEEQLDAIREKWGLNDPPLQQYMTWVTNLLTGDLGTSMMRPGVPISEMITDAGLMTLRLTILSFLIATSIAIPIGVIAAVKRYSWFDYGSMFGSTLGVAVPNYWIGLMAIVIFSVQLGWVPPYGADSWQAYILPVTVLAIEEMAALARLTRGATIEVLGQDYVTTGRAKGLADLTV